MWKKENPLPLTHMSQNKYTKEREEFYKVWNNDGSISIKRHERIWQFIQNLLEKKAGVVTYEALTGFTIKKGTLFEFVDCELFNSLPYSFKKLSHPKEETLPVIKHKNLIDVDKMEKLAAKVKESLIEEGKIPKEEV